MPRGAILAGNLILLLEATPESQPIKERLSRIESAWDYVNAWFLFWTREVTRRVSRVQSLAQGLGTLCRGSWMPFVEPP